MIVTALGALIALRMISPDRIDHDVARGMIKGAGADGRARPSGLSVLLHNRGLILLALVMLFHFGNAPMSWLIAQEFSIQLGTPFRTTALITGVAQAAMIAVAAVTPWLIRRFGLRLCFLIALCALPLRGILAGMIPEFRVVVPVQMLDGIGAGMLGILTPVAAERLLANTGRFNLGFAAVMTVQGIGATISNVFAGWIVSGHGYGMSHFIGAGVAVAALALFVIFSRTIAPGIDGAGGRPDALTFDTETNKTGTYSPVPVTPCLSPPPRFPRFAAVSRILRARCRPMPCCPSGWRIWIAACPRAGWPLAACTSLRAAVRGPMMGPPPPVSPPGSPRACRVRSCGA